MAVAASDRGTWCWTPDFMRFAVMRHSRASRSISVHLAPRASPDLAAVKPVRLDGLFGRFAECWNSGSDLLGERVPSVGDGHAVGEGALSCLGEADDGECKHA